MENMDFVYDPFCEKAFWTNNNHNNNSVDKNTQDFSVTNPICAVTGGLMVVMVLCTSNIEDYLKEEDGSMVKSSGGEVDCGEVDHSAELAPFALCRASLAVVGAGTVVFHSIDDQTGIDAFNFRMCDRMPIVLMCTNIFLLYFVKLRVRMSVSTLSLWFFAIYMYMCGLILAVDSATYEHLTLKWNDNSNTQNVYETYMNVGLLCPVGVILVYAMTCHQESLHLFALLWLLIGVNLIMWALNAYLCRAHTAMFILHALYHVTISYTFLFAACVGMTFDGNWGLHVNDYCWPMVVRLETPANRQLASSDLNSGRASSLCKWDNPKNVCNLKITSL